MQLLVKNEKHLQYILFMLGRTSLEEFVNNVSKWRCVMATFTFWHFFRNACYSISRKYGIFYYTIPMYMLIIWMFLMNRLAFICLFIFPLIFRLGNSGPFNSIDYQVCLKSYQTDCIKLIRPQEIFIFFKIVPLVSLTQRDISID